MGTGIPLPMRMRGADSVEPPQRGSTELENASRPKEPTHTHAFCLANRRLPFTFHSARRTYHLVQKICALSLPTGGLPIQPAKIGDTFSHQADYSRETHLAPPMLRTRTGLTFQ